MVHLISKTRAEILRLFFTNPEQPFFMNEIGRALGKKPGVFQRALNSMEAEGILRSEYKAHARYFRLNPEYHFYDELKAIVEKTTGAAESIRKLLKDFPEIDAAFIYGSFAKERQNAFSDIDLMVIGKPDEDRLLLEIDKLEKALRREINYRVLGPDALRKALANSDPFLDALLKDKKLMVKGDENDLRTIRERKPR